MELSLELHDIARNQVQEKQLLEKKTQQEDQMAQQAAGLSSQDAELAQLRLEFQQQEA